MLFRSSMYEHKKMKITVALAKDILQGALPLLQQQAEWSDEALKATLSSYAEARAVKSGQVFLPLRLAITAAAVTPGGATEIAELLGKEESLARLKYSLSLLENA